MRYASLDALRGIASLMVLTHHCVLAGLVPVPPGFWTGLSRYTPLHLFVSGRPPVILFFVLSGFVLAISLNRPGTGYAAFAVRRLCRIYLPYAAASGSPRSRIGAAPSRRCRPWRGPPRPGASPPSLA